MSAVLKFTGNWQGRFKPGDMSMAAQANALHDARQIMAAKAEANNWMSALLLGILSTMDKDRAECLELCLAAQAGRNDEALRAYSVVRLQNSSSEYRDRVVAAIDVLQESA